MLCLSSRAWQSVFNLSSGSVSDKCIRGHLILSGPICEEPERHLCIHEGQALYKCTAQSTTGCFVSVVEVVLGGLAYKRPREKLRLRAELFLQLA